MNGDSGAVWIATWEIGCWPPGAQNRWPRWLPGQATLPGGTTVQAQHVLWNHSCLSFVCIWTCLFFFEQGTKALQLIEYTHPSTHWE